MGASMEEAEPSPGASKVLPVEKIMKASGGTSTEAAKEQRPLPRIASIIFHVLPLASTYYCMSTSSDVLALPASVTSMRVHVLPQSYMLMYLPKITCYFPFFHAEMKTA